MSPFDEGMRMGAGAVGLDARVAVGGMAGVDDLGGGADSGVWTDSSVTGAAPGGGLDDLENSFLKTPNINRAARNHARSLSPRR
jgi:hypothetical protein